MRSSDKLRHANVARVLLSGVPLLAFAVAVGRTEAASSSSPAACELRIEGEAIENLVLEEERGRRQGFSKPGPVVTLPPGRYRLSEARLSGGYMCWPHLVPENRWTVVEANHPAVLKVGGPLRQTVKAERQGTSMVLQYQLLGQGGEQYAPADASGRPPAFAVYHGERKVASGAFEPG